MEDVDFLRVFDPNGILPPERKLPWGDHVENCYHHLIEYLDDCPIDENCMAELQKTIDEIPDNEVAATRRYYHEFSRRIEAEAEEAMLLLRQRLYKRDAFFAMFNSMIRRRERQNRLNSPQKQT